LLYVRRTSTSWGHLSLLASLDFVVHVVVVLFIIKLWRTTHGGKLRRGGGMGTAMIDGTPLSLQVQQQHAQLFSASLLPSLSASDICGSDRDDDEAVAYEMSSDVDEHSNPRSYDPADDEVYMSSSYR
jgi:hypothetical protein